MKNTLVSILLFVLLISLFPNKALALSSFVDEIKDSVQIKFPTATPTPIPNLKIEKVIDVDFEKMPLTTATPTPKQVVVTQVVTATPKPTIEAEISPTIAQNPTVEPSLTATQEEKTDEKTDLSKWFWQITVGMLVLIVIIQLWPKKKEEIKDKKDDLQP